MTAFSAGTRLLTRSVKVTGQSASLSGKPAAGKPTVLTFFLERTIL